MFAAPTAPTRNQSTRGSHEVINGIVKITLLFLAYLTVTSPATAQHNGMTLGYSGGTGADRHDHLGRDQEIWLYR